MKKKLVDGYQRGAETEYLVSRATIASVAVHWHYLQNALREIAGGKPSAQQIAQVVLNSEFGQDGADLIREIQREEKKQMAVNFHRWIRGKKYIEDEEGFWYEPSTYRSEKEPGVCAATSLEDLYERFLEATTLMT